MKRSEAEIKLAEKIFVLWNDDKPKHVSRAAKELLDFIENELKMLPPTYRHEDGDLGSYLKNMWEPES